MNLLEKFKHFFIKLLVPKTKLDKISTTSTTSTTQGVSPDTQLKQVEQIPENVIPLSTDDNCFVLVS